MISDRPWHHLNINTDHAISQKGHEYFGNIVKNNSMNIAQTRDIELFNPDWLQQLCECTQNEVSSIMVFYRPSYHQYPTAHIDLNTNYIKETGQVSATCAAVNMIYNGANDDSEMIWYQCPAYTQDDVQWTMAQTAYLDFDPKTLTEVSRCCIGNNVTLVRTDLPHNIIMGQTPRLSISIRFKWLGWQDPSWSGIVEQCQPCLRSN